MKSFLLAFPLFLVAAPAMRADDAARQPVYIYLYARLTDHANMGVTEDRLRRLLPMVEKYRKAYPGAHVSATVLFSGAVSQALAEKDRQTHLVEFVKDHVRRGLIEVGYDGTDEPTYQHRPILDFSNAQTSEERWSVRQAAYEKLLTQARDPLTGAPAANGVGGLEEMRKVFGDPACIAGMTMLMNVVSAGPRTEAPAPGQEPSGPHFNRPLTRRSPPLTGLTPEVGGDSELIQLLRREGITAMMFGIGDGNPGLVPGIAVGRVTFGRLMSPVAETSPEVYWQDDVLRSSEAIGPIRPGHADEGPDALKAMLEKVDRSRIHVIHVEVAAVQNYLQPEFIKGTEFPPTKYAYDHPESPRLPKDALLARADVDTAYAKEESTLKWLVQEFFPANSGSQMVSSSQLVEMVTPATGFSVSVADLRVALAGFLKTLGNNTTLPALFQADEHYLSPANMFQVMTDALAEFSRTGEFPQSVKVVEVYGPVRLYTGHGPNAGEVSVASIARTCTEIDAALHDQTPGQFPKNAIPSFLKVDGIEMNPAQFLRLMALALTNASPSPDTKLAVRMLYPFTGSIISYPKTRPIPDSGFGWTLKPAPLAPEPAGRQEARATR